MVQTIKKLDADGIHKIQSLENKVGCCIVALEHQPPVARLSKAQLADLQVMEQEIDAVLVAYECTTSKVAI